MILEWNCKKLNLVMVLLYVYEKNKFKKLFFGY